jgi:peptide-methionine (R)-S-oxide reductase
MHRLFLALILFLSVRLSLAGDPEGARIRRQLQSIRMNQKVLFSENQWRKILTPPQFQVLRQAKTEPPYRNQYWDNRQKGIYLCAACGSELFSSDTKFESRTGWPSFYAPLAMDKITTTTDTSHEMIREEVRCARCGSHLGHLFNDDRTPTNDRYCLNSIALKFKGMKNQ